MDISAIIGVIGGLMIIFGLVILLIGIATYIFFALALMAIAKKTNTENPWLAWIPIANIYLMTKIGKVPWWTMFGLLLALIPAIGWLLTTALGAFWWWKIAEARGKPGWLGILTIIPLANFIVIGILAWAD